MYFYVCMYVRTYVCLCMYLCMYVLCTYVRVSIYARNYVCLCMCTYVYVYMYVLFPLLSVCIPVNLHSPLQLPATLQAMTPSDPLNSYCDSTVLHTVLCVRLNACVLVIVPLVILYIVLYVVFIQTVFCLTTGPKPFPKRFLHTVRSRASSFK
jgi:hypothetical protein